MPFVKIDTGILRSTLWFDRAQRDVFLSALFMADLHELREETPQLGVDIPDPTGWVVPAGWYGFVQAAGVGIAHVAQVTWPEAMLALKAMGEPERDSRSQEFEGRRLVRINGGYIVLNYMKYRDRDYTAAERQMRYRARKRSASSIVTTGVDNHGVTPLPLRDPVTPNVTEAVTVTDSRVQSTEYISKEVRTLPKGRESLASERSERFSRFYDAYPRKKAPAKALKAFKAINPDDALLEDILAALNRQKRSRQWQDPEFIPFPATWLTQRRWQDEPEPSSEGPPRTSAATPPAYLDPLDCRHDPICPNRDWHVMKLQVGSL
jgi:hypothetical protein